MQISVAKHNKVKVSSNLYLHVFLVNLIDVYTTKMKNKRSNVYLTKCKEKN